MTLELKQYKDEFFDNSTEPYALGGVKEIGLMPKHEEYFFITIFDTRIFVPESFEYVKDRDTGKYFVRDGKWVADNINEAPTVDAVEVVRCENCKHYAMWGDGRAMNHCDKHDRIAYGNDFCSYGERKVDAG